MRLFVALEAPSARLPSIFGTHGNAPAHLTLRFLGEVSPERVAAIGNAVDEAARSTPAFHYVLAGAGAFPSRARPRVLWVGVTEGAEGFQSLSSRLASSLLTVGFPPEARPFSPHVTVHRIRNAVEARTAREWLATHARDRFDEAEASELLLKESVLRPDGARHQTLGRYSLLREARDAASDPGSLGAPSATHRLQR